MTSKIKAIIKKYHLVGFALSVAFNVSRPLGFIRFPSYNLYFRLLMNAARAGYWSPRLGKMGKGVQIDSGVIILGNPRNLEIGDYSYIDTNVKLEVNDLLRIGKHVHMANDVHIQSGDEVILGDFVAIAAGSRIYASSNTYKAPDGREKDILLSMSASAPAELQYVEYGPVIIEEYAFVGLNCVILPGVRIGRGAVIGAGSVVTKDIPPYTIAIGIPARPVKNRVIPKSEAKE